MATRNAYFTKLVSLSEKHDASAPLKLKRHLQDAKSIQDYEDFAEFVETQSYRERLSVWSLINGHTYIHTLVEYLKFVKDKALPLDQDRLVATLAFLFGVMLVIHEKGRDPEVVDGDGDSDVLVTTAQDYFEPVGDVLLQIFNENFQSFCEKDFSQLLIASAFCEIFVAGDVILSRLTRNFDDYWRWIIFEYPDATSLDHRNLRAVLIEKMMEHRKTREPMPSWLVNKFKEKDVVRYLLDAYPTDETEFNASDKRALERLGNVVEIVSRNQEFIEQFVKGDIIEKTGALFKWALTAGEYGVANFALLGLLHIVGPDDEKRIQRVRASLPFIPYMYFVKQLGEARESVFSVVFGTRFYMAEFQKVENHGVQLVVRLATVAAWAHLTGDFDINCDKYSGNLYRLISWKRCKDAFVEYGGKVKQGYVNSRNIKLTVKDLAETAKRFIFTSPSKKYAEFLQITKRNLRRQDSGAKLEQIARCFDEGCATCGESAELACGGCNAIKYCDRDCQKWDWSRHKSECHSKVS